MRIGPYKFGATFRWGRCNMHLHVERACIYLAFFGVRAWVEDTRYVEITYCGECDEEAGDDGLRTVSAGDESWSVCESCRSVEGSSYTKMVRYE